jgi:putative cardiolipin synthase
MSLRRGAALGILALGLSVVLIRASSTLPSLDYRSASFTQLDTGDTRLGKAITPLVDTHPGKSGIYPLPSGPDAFAARVLLARAAERTLDIQYYIWHEDKTGTMLFEALHDAAVRGIRVRLLLDDINTSGLDPVLAALDSHSNIEVRLFNPFVIRSPRAIGYVFDFFRANRRMHNKSFTADNQATIIGGRNVGDEYFGAAEGALFVDLDVMAVGPVVAEVSQDFDRYWASGSSYPVELLLPDVDPTIIARLATTVSRIERDRAAAAYINALRSSSFVAEFVQGRLPLEWATTRMVSDDPAKGVGLAPPEALLPQKLKAIIGEPASNVELVASYFVPSATGIVEPFVELAEKGVTIRVLTNSLEATDVAVVHAGYAKWRKALLEPGITLYELRRLSPVPEANRSAGPFGSSGASLHAKTFSVDRSRIFIGSFNFDPRSAKLNTELGFVIDSPALAQRMEALFDSSIPANAYQVHLSDTGQLYWTERRGQELVRHDTEPGTSLWQRAWVRFLSLLPIDALL